ncbi:MAG TPA: DUF1553 domain-containing protein [Thermoanaerobaculia bacterium]|jgi:hypothetical protein|nr:DUF1553 domain-containing protein [Thermoanaerobaculia bacterium]
MKRIVAVVLLLMGVVHASGDSRRRAVGKPASGGTLPVANFIDTHVGAKLSTAGIVPAQLAKDEEFLRRVTVDLTGTIPLATEVDAFVNDPRIDKRARKIDDLLNSSAFVDRWTMWYGDLVQNVQASDAVRQYYLGRNVHYQWIKESIRTGKPYDAMVREDLAGEGDSFTVGVTNYIVRQLQRNGPPQDTYDNLAAHSAEKFLGIPLLCLSCHGGPGHLELVNIYLRGKSREDFWKMAAFFSRTRIRGSRYVDPANPNADPIQYNVSLIPNGTYQLNTNDGNKTPRAPAAGQPNTVTPAFLTTGEQPKPGEPYRAAYARMLTADRQFARATVNYLWKEMFGIGIVDPVNAFDLARLTSQPSHPELLEALADEFIASGYNLRGLLRTIALSNTYQLSSTYSGTHPDPTYFARRSPRRLSAEALLDAVTTATSVPLQMQVVGIGNVQKAMQLPDPLEARRSPASLFLNEFGRGDRDSVARTNDGAITQALAMMNNGVVTTRVRRSTVNSTVAKVLASTSDPGTIADQLYLATLSRRPTASERQTAIDYLRAGALNERAEDLQFVLLNSLEFLFV